MPIHKIPEVSGSDSSNP